jgi:hypothetical protein
VEHSTDRFRPSTPANKTLGTFGSAGFMDSLFCQVGYACLVGGGPAAIAGAILGRSIENRVFIARGS